mgnify:FL=1
MPTTRKGALNTKIEEAKTGESQDKLETDSQSLNEEMRIDGPGQDNNLSRSMKPQETEEMIPRSMLENLMAQLNESMRKQAEYN